MSQLPVPIGGTVPVAGTGTSLALAEPLTERAHHYALAEKCEATRRAYRSDFADFRTWCLAHGQEHLPASVEATAAYLASLADRGLRASTVSRRAAAIAYAHKLAGHEPPTSAEQLRATIRGIRRTIGVAADQKAPATADVVRDLLRHVPKTGTLGLRDRALLLVGFAAALRRSELVGLDVADLDFSREGVILRLGVTKTDQEGAGAIAPIPNGTKLKPVAALSAWLSAAGIADGPVFRRIRRGGHVTAERLTPAAVALIVKRYAGPAGYAIADFAGHSLRAGFVTQALADGADLLKVMDQSRHVEVRTLKKYDRRAKAFRGHAGKGFL